MKRIVDLTLAEPPGETTHWTGRAMARHAYQTAIEARGLSETMRAVLLASATARGYITELTLTEVY